MLLNPVVTGFSSPAFEESTLVDEVVGVISADALDGLLGSLEISLMGVAFFLTSLIIATPPIEDDEATSWESVPCVSDQDETSHTRRVFNNLRFISFISRSMLGACILLDVGEGARPGSLEGPDSVG